jgi:DNA-directed RNA polymerase subunit RPC12/RpoP
MAEEQRYLYHCDRCGELFKSKLRAIKDLRCSTCGEHPVLPKFNALEDFRAKHKAKKKRKQATTGNKVSNSLTIQKQQQLRQWLAIAVISLAVISTISVMVLRMHEKSKRASKVNVVLDEADREYLARKNAALEKCKARFNAFAAENVVHAKSAHIFNGSDLVLDINRYYSSNLMNGDFSASQMVEFELIESGEQPKAIALYKFQPDEDQTSVAYNFEVLFMKKGKNWLVDWSYLVRLGEMNWFNFNEDKKVNSPKKFRLYMRQPNAQSIILNGYEEYKLSEPFNNSVLPSQLSTSAFIKHQTVLKSKLTQRFREQEEINKQNDQSKIVGSFDPPGTIRVLASVDHEEIDGELVMVIKEIHQLNWETPVE